MAKVSTAAFDGNPARYSTEQWERACVLDKGDSEPLAKQRFAVPVREPDGTLNALALAKAAEALAADTETDEAQIEKAQATLAKRFAKAGLPVRVELAKAKLSSKQRNALPNSAFALSKDRRYPIHDESHARNALARASGKPEEAQVRAAVKRKFPGIDVSKSELEMQVPLWKDDARQIVYGVALVPGLMDSQGDIVGAEEIEKTAHAFLTEYRKHDVQHTEVTAGFGGKPIAQTVESFIAPDDMELAGQRVVKGSWVLGVKVADPDVWSRVVKGEITGFSIGGTGERVPIAA